MKKNLKTTATTSESDFSEEKKKPKQNRHKIQQKKRQLTFSYRYVRFNVFLLHTLTSVYEVFNPCAGI